MAGGLERAVNRRVGVGERGDLTIGGGVVGRGAGERVVPGTDDLFGQAEPPRLLIGAATAVVVRADFPRAIGASHLGWQPRIGRWLNVGLEEAIGIEVAVLEGHEWGD